MSRIDCHPFLYFWDVKDGPCGTMTLALDYGVLPEQTPSLEFPVIAQPKGSLQKGDEKREVNWELPKQLSTQFPGCCVVSPSKCRLAWHTDDINGTELHDHQDDELMMSIVAELQNMEDVYGYCTADPCPLLVFKANLPAHALVALLTHASDDSQGHACVLPSQLSTRLPACFPS
ncbi:hypothetical protein TREES_T100017712 [Tupaia chinensis]|uniref:Uncharacterized protein n=1 Tax=Tupaia chinensis TaxID=246437 RepID=L9KSS0_TUPCH|nr:hypothetical protein TREES_T100017712 [Tupaia chinensis]